MTLLSVIVPVYRVQGFLDECLDSILATDRLDIEVIAVDDCSPDGSAAILRHRAAHDPRLIVTATPRNLGLGPARNTGLDRARGRWVWFVDSDDTLAPGAIDAVCARLGDDAPDVLFVDYVKTYPDRDPVPSTMGDLLRRRPPPARFDLDAWPAVMELMNAAWTKIVRRDLLAEHGLRFPPGWYEDIPWTYRLVLTARDMSILDEPLYRYRQRRSGSITATGGPRHFELFDQWARLWQDIADVGDHVKALVYHRMVWHYLQVVGNDRRIPAGLRREFFLRAASDYHRYGIGVPESRPPLRERVKRGILRRRRYRLYWMVRALGRIVRAARRLTRRPAGLPSPPLAARLAPIDRDLVVYVSTSPSDTPSDLADIRTRLRQTHPRARHAWMTPDSFDPALFARARHVLCDTDLPTRPRRGTRVVRLVTHTPVGPTGLDQPGADPAAVIAQADALDAIAVDCEYTAGVIDRAWQPTVPIVVTGTSTTAALAGGVDVRAAKRNLGVPADTRVITRLVGPGKNTDDTRHALAADEPGHVDGGAAAAGRDHSVLTGYIVDGVVRFPGRPAAALADVLAATDVLVTNGAALTPYLLLDRPVVPISQIDGLPDPGPLAADAVDLAAAINVAAEPCHRRARYTLRERLGVPDTADAVDRIIALLLDTPHTPPAAPAPVAVIAEPAADRAEENV